MDRTRIWENLHTQYAAGLPRLHLLQYRKEVWLEGKFRHALFPKDAPKFPELERSSPKVQREPKFLGILLWAGLSRE